MSEATYDVAIVGCGPTGATLANLLRARGRAVAVLDREEQVFPAPRAMVIDPESCRIFDEMGILPGMFPDDASPFEHHEFVDEKRRLLMALDGRGQPHSEFGFPPGGLMFHQPSLERLLRRDFQKGVGVDAMLGWEVTSVDGRSSPARIEARHESSGETRQITAQYIVGADGGGSRCRKAIGSPRVDFHYKRKWVVIDVIVHDQAVFDSLRAGSEFKCCPNGAVVFVKGHRNHVRFDFEAGDEVAATFDDDDARALIAQYFDPASVEIIRRQPYLFYAAMPERWRDGRLLLAGDAAHLTSPFSGQGLNMGIRDAANLAFKLDLVLRGVCGDALLDTYQEERWDNCAALIEGATRRGKMISASTRLAILKRNFAFLLGRLSHRAGFEMTRRMNDRRPYRAGLLDGSSGAGEVMIRPRVRVADREVWFEQVLGSEFALVTAEGAEGPSTRWFETVLDGRIAEIGRDFDDVHGQVQAWLDRHGATSVMVRPDRYVFGTSAMAEESCASLRKAFAALDARPPREAR